MVEEKKSERQMVLEMLKEGKITTGEADKLLDEMEKEVKGGSLEGSSLNKKFLRIRVTEDTGDTNVNINIPIALAEVGLKMVPEDKMKVKGQEINIDHILQLIEEGTEGELVNIDINEDGKNTKVNIFID
jgi:polyhydroxyalkanoate synthesis regulator phasin